MVTLPHPSPASLPPPGLDGLDPAWSRLVRTPHTDGVGRTWHLLDNQAADAHLTLLCVHGNPSWSYLYRDLVRRAPDGVRVIAVDQLEMGFSERSGQLRRLATRIDDLCALTEELGLDGPVVTVAHDWGGPVSLGWAQRHRDQLAGLVLMNTAVSQPPGSRVPTLIGLARSRALLRGLTVRSTGFIDGALAMSRPRITRRVRRGFVAPYRATDRRAAIETFVADIPVEPDHPTAAAMQAVADGLDDLARHTGTAVVGLGRPGVLGRVPPRPRAPATARRRPPLPQGRPLPHGGRRRGRRDRGLDAPRSGARST